MGGMFLKWIIFGVVTIVAGTVAATIASGANVVSDLTMRSAQALEADTLHWAQLSFAGRDVVISGTATDEADVEAAVARVAAVHGVRSVVNQAELAPLASPYPFTATLVEGLVAIAGGTPDAALTEEIAMEAGATSAELKLLSGAPDRALWRDAISYALKHLAQFDEGKVEVADLTVTVSGRAKSRQAFDALAILSRAAPGGISVASLSVVPPLASPYEWRAKFDGNAVAVSGLAPDEATIDAMRAAVTIPVSTSLVLASGEPEGFAATTTLLLKNLVQLEQGEASIIDGKVTLSGAPPSKDVAQAVVDDLNSANSIVTLAPPRVREYVFTAAKADGTTVLDGYVPDEETQQRLAQAGGDVTGLELARGAPERFGAALDFGLKVLDHLSEGRFAFRDGIIVLKGRAATSADLEAVSALLADGAPQGAIMALAEIRPPLAVPFLWSAEKLASGNVALAGLVPSAAVRDSLAAVAGAGPPDGTEIADGAPDTFAADATAGLQLLSMLDSGKLTFDGSAWSLSGTAATPLRALSADTAFAASGLKDAGWTYVVSLPPAAKSAALPRIEPYAFKAEKLPAGTVALSGYVPNRGLKTFLGLRAGDPLVDSTVLGAGAPDDFATDAVAGLAALLKLDEGELLLNDRIWSLSGASLDPELPASLRSALSAAVDIANWKVAIDAPDPPPPPLPAPQVTAALPAVAPSPPPPPPVAELEAIATAPLPPPLPTAPAPASAAAELSAAAARAAGPTVADKPAPETAAAAIEAAAPLASESTLAEEPVKAETAAAASAIEAAVAATAPPVSEPEPAAPEDVEVAAIAPPPPAVPEPVVLGPPIFNAARTDGGPLALTGVVPTEATRSYFGVIAGTAPTESMQVAENLPSDFISSATAGIRALTQLSTGTLAFDGTHWALQGLADREAERQAALQGLPETGGWVIELAITPPIDLCRREVASFSSRNSILFQSGRAVMTEESVESLDELAAYLAQCPEASVDVEGHTDADGPDDLNLALSVARAEAVVAALVERGVAEDRLYAVGYGESAPIAANETNAGKQANRRIVFTIAEENL
jgi:outer membrane protein OmpA-like peptidoglycan-associated protein